MLLCLQIDLTYTTSLFSISKRLHHPDSFDNLGIINIVDKLCHILVSNLSHLFTCFEIRHTLAGVCLIRL